MTDIKTTKIPQRQKCIDKEHPYIGGAVDIIDDDLQLTQAKINEIVLGGSITPNLISNKPAVFVGEATSVTLTATISTPADSIKIKKGSTVIATGSGTSLSGTDSVTPSSNGNIAYTAEFAIGGLTKTASRNVAAVYPIYYGAGAAYTAATTKASARTTPAGTYNVVVPNNEDYVFFVVPRTMNINSAKMSGFDFPLQAPVNVEIEGVEYKYYQSANTYDAGTLTIVIS